MPKITIVEQDLTGVSYTGDETVVYVPGIVPFKEGVKPDNNGCLLIRPSANIANIFKVSTLTETSTEDEKQRNKLEVKTMLYVESLLNQGLYVIYNHFENFMLPTREEVTTEVDGGVDEEGKPIKETITTLEEIPYKLPSVSYLKDKNMYNVKYLTCGIYPTVVLSKTVDEKKKEEVLSIDSGFAGILAPIAEARQDCVVLCDIDRATEPEEGGALEIALTPAGIKHVLDNAGAGIISEYCALFYPNGNYKLTSSVFPGMVDVDCVMPASFGYLLNAGEAIKVNKKWDSVSGVHRGVLPGTFSGNIITLSKYDLDTDVMDPEIGGVCFNGIVDINAFGYTIWGDRTLRKNAEGVHGLKAGSFLSTRLMLCDIKKRVYAAAIQNTYETNNDVTWMNFKNQITSLLNVMSSDGKLDSFKVTKLPSDYMSQIKCKIKLVPNMPVEDFYVYITLENAEAEVTEG